MQYTNEVTNKLIERLNILDNIWSNQVINEKNCQQKQILFMQQQLKNKVKRKKLITAKLRKRRHTAQQVARNKLIAIMRSTNLY